ncbi:hypothetical protein [Flammeovirga aprica]|uniref:Uncharacterized protein n=1 Tax=Flammeovirga aprica JL-4 TaxID=694437 RepID=A0A7X9RUN9_9BACT|nr:hypothetical protein [Flammeovirga aprica]NME69037.1 hypothetical protein [Flammeovirga aprica JL-4]
MAERKKNATVHLRVSPTFKELLKAKAGCRELSITQYIKILVEKDTPTTLKEELEQSKRILEATAS